MPTYNRINDYLSVVSSVADNIAADAEQACFDTDTGQSSDMAEGRANAIEAIDEHIRTLQVLRKEVVELGVRDLLRKYDVAGESIPAR